MAALYLVTGIMAAGKSTIGQALAERFPKSVHLRGDLFRRAVVNGRQEMGPDPTAEALSQLRLRYRLAAAAADSYVEAGFTTVVQDIVIGPMLEEFVSFVRHRPLVVVVLAPTVDEVARREAGRAKSGYGALSPADLDRVLREETPRLGYWIDSSDLTVEETVARIIEAAPRHAVSG
ncbi:MAG: AAA family ATPase [Acidimicrobiales bacterium]